MVGQGPKNPTYKSAPAVKRRTGSPSEERTSRKVEMLERGIDQSEEIGQKTEESMLGKVPRRACQKEPMGGYSNG